MRKFFLIVMFLVFAPCAFAQQSGSEGSEPVIVAPVYQSDTPSPVWGVSSSAVAVISASRLIPNSDGTGFTSSGSGVFETTAGGDWWGGIQVPSGALVERVELDGCDTSATAALVFGLARSTSPGGTAFNVAVGSTGGPATPGCAFFNAIVATPFTMDNDAASLHVFLSYGATDNTTRAQAIRVYYRLQVSPAPATATFPNDVPTSHPFFRFIEALAASGVTSGCAPGSFCPNSPITRGEMAVFLSAALGLHFAP